MILLYYDFLLVQLQDSIYYRLRQINFKKILLDDIKELMFTVLLKGTLMKE
jgi:hypothetical protein